MLFCSSRAAFCLASINRNCYQLSAYDSRCHLKRAWKKETKGEKRAKDKKTQGRREKERQKRAKDKETKGEREKNRKRERKNSVHSAE